jgi:diaminopimelate decarboxylase
VQETCDIAGNICESGDILAKDRKLPKLKKGDLLAILDAGAYGMSMASVYNSRPLPAEILVRGKRIDLIRERGGQEDLYWKQRIPNDLI